MTLANVAELMQSKVPTVARHETQNNEMTLATLERYAQIYGVQVEELLPDAMRVAPSLAALLDLGQKLTPDLRAQLVRLGYALAEPARTYEVEPRKR